VVVAARRLVYPLEVEVLLTHRRVVTQSLARADKMINYQTLTMAVKRANLTRANLHATRVAVL
jgi:hypothetical protein